MHREHRCEWPSDVPEEPALPRLSDAKRIWLIINSRAESHFCARCVLWGHWGVLGARRGVQHGAEAGPSHRGASVPGPFPSS